jgi:hypothetical protein
MSDTEFDNTSEPDDTDTETQDVDSDVEDGDGETGAEAAAKPKPPAAKKSDESATEPFTPPTEAEWRRIQTALKKANDDAKRNRFRAKELEEKTRADETEHEKALREAREEGEKRYRAPLVKAAARAALSEAGLGGSTDRVLRLLDLEALSVDDDGDVIGLDGEVARVKDEYPEFFQADKPKSRVRPTAADRKPAEEKPKTSAERHAAKVLGRAG